MSDASPTPDAPPKPPDHNRTGVNFRAPMPRPKVNGVVIDFHTHLLAARHAKVWFEAAAHFGIDAFVTMTPLEEAMGVQRDYPDRVQFIAVPSWGDKSENWMDQWLRRIEMFYNLGSRIVKFHNAPGTIAGRGFGLESPQMQRLVQETVDRNMIVMTHMGDPDTWFATKYTDAAKFGTRESHYAVWEELLGRYRGHPWLGAHMGGNPEDLERLQGLLDRHPGLYLDTSATKWMVREISARRDEAREFFIRNQDRLLFGSDQVSTDDRGFDFLASRFWSHRKLWETAYIGPSPIFDPDLPEDKQPTLRGLALPDGVLQKIYHNNGIEFLAKVGVSFGGWG